MSRLIGFVLIIIGVTQACQPAQEPSRELVPKTIYDRVEAQAFQVLEERKALQDTVKKLRDHIVELEARLAHWKAEAKAAESGEPYLEGVPPAPPFREAQAWVRVEEGDGCWASDDIFTGYVISFTNDYEQAVIQAKDGTRETYFFSTNGMSNADASWMPVLLRPGNLLKMKVVICGAGGYHYVKEVEALPRLH